MLDMLIRNSGDAVINHKKIARIKREYGLVTKIRKSNPYKNLQKATEEHSQLPNLLNRNFVTPLSNRIYSTDMTYLFYGRSEKAYLSATKDLGDNVIVSHNVMKSPTIGNFVNEFRSLLTELPLATRKQLIVHSDQGYQYTHPEFRNLLKETGVQQSMSRRGNCLDNAPIESFFGHFKDLIDLKGCKTFEEVSAEVERAIKYYNNERPQKVLNKKPPAEYRGLISGFF